MKNDNRNIRGVVVVLALILAGLTSSQAGEFSGVMYTDYTADFSENPRGPNNRFDLRRIYFTYDTPLRGSDELSFRVRTDIQKDPAIGRWRPILKRAFVRFDRDNISIRFGLVPTTVYAVQQKEWGHRWIEKSPMDKWGLGKSEEMGVIVQGVLTDGVKWDAMMSNGRAAQWEVDDAKHYGAGLSFGGQKLLLRVYAGYEDYDDGELTLAGMIRIGSGNLRVGLEFDQQWNQGGVINVNERVLSGFAFLGITEQLGMVLRADFDDPIRDASGTDINDAETFFFLGGITFKAAEGLTLGIDYQHVKDELFANTQKLFFTTEVRY